MSSLSQTQALRLDQGRRSDPRVPGPTSSTNPRRRTPLDPRDLGLLDGGKRGQGRLRQVLRLSGRAQVAAECHLCAGLRPELLTEETEVNPARRELQVAVSARV